MSNNVPQLNQCIFPPLPSGDYLTLVNSITTWNDLRDQAAAMLIHCCVETKKWQPIAVEDFMVALVTVPKNFSVLSGYVVDAALDMVGTGLLEEVVVGTKKYIVPTPRFAQLALKNYV